MYKNTVALMITMLGCLEVDTGISGTDMKTTKSNNCRGISGNDRDANGILVTMCKRAGFSCKDR